jgi:hypothetical protein
MLALAQERACSGQTEDAKIIFSVLALSKPNVCYQLSEAYPGRDGWYQVQTERASKKNARLEMMDPSTRQDFNSLGENV